MKSFMLTILLGFACLANDLYGSEIPSKLLNREGFYTGIDWYYRVYSPYPSGPANYDAEEKCKMSLMTRAVEGEFFEPRTFWKQSMDEQLKYLKDEIINCHLLDTVKTHYVTPGTSQVVRGIPYDIKDEMAFREAVWPKIQKFIAENHLHSLTKKQFYDSLMININPPNPWEDAPADAPLIRHFARYISPLWGRLPYSHLKQYPSWFEMFIIGDKDPEDFMKEAEK